MGKKWKAAAALVEPRPYDLREAVELVKRTAYAKFDETVEMALRLGVDPKRSDRESSAWQCPRAACARSSQPCW